MTNEIGSNTIEPETAETYIERAKLLRREFERAGGIYTPHVFAEWLVAAKLALSARTWRLYRAAVVYYMSVKHPEEAASISQYLSGFTAIKKEAKETPRVRKKTKNYTDQRFQTLIAHMESMAAKPLNSVWWANALFSMLAGNLVGLRPVEWKHARLEIKDGIQFLVVKNAKNTHGRSHGDYRTLDLSAFTQPDIQIIQKKIELTSAALAEGHAKSIQHYHAQIRKYVLRANIAIDPTAKTTIAPYSTRHQVSANLKLENSHNEVAAILGHRSNETASAHYGKRRSGRSKSNSPKATPDDVSRVATFNPSTPKTFTPKTTQYFPSL